MIIKSDDTRTIAQIFKVPSIQQLYDSPVAGIYDNPPWVEIGNVYASLIITGEDSWTGLVKGNTDNFAVVGGRHGNIINPISANKVLDVQDIATSIDDPAHINLDAAKAKQFGSRVQIVDVHKYGGLQTGSGLKELCARYHQFDGTKVILAWCYGIFTYCESTRVKFGDDVSNPKHGEFSRFDALLKMSVKDIVNTYWT